MNTENVLLGIFVALTLVFASLTLGEYSRVTPTQTITSTTTATTTIFCPSNMVCGSFTYSPTGQVKVESVEANYSVSQFSSAMTFWVTFENNGSSPIYFPAYALNASVATNSSALREIFHPYFGSVTEGTSPLYHGQSYTLFSPYSGDDYDFLLVQGGTVDVNLNFTWDTVYQPTQCSNPPCPFQTLSSGTTVISAQFTFDAPTERPLGSQ